MFHTRNRCVANIARSLPASAPRLGLVLSLCVVCAAGFAATDENADPRLEQLGRLGMVAGDLVRANQAAKDLLDRFAGTLAPAESALLIDAEDGTWNTHSLLQAALVAGGVHQRQELLRYENRYRAVVAAMRQSLPDRVDEEECGRHLLEMLHGQLLTGGYRLSATELPPALDEGQFNCVSATVLFICVAEEFGLHAQAVESTGHLAALVFLQGRPLRVETTCSTWFRLSADQQQRQSAAIAVREGRSAAARSEVPLSQRLGRPAAAADRPENAATGSSLGYDRPRAISPVQLVAAIYYNRGVDLLLAEQFEAAAVCNAKALLLDPENLPAWGNLLATLNNWAIHLAKAGKYTEAVELLEQGLALAPEYRPFQWNLRQAIRRRDQDATARSAPAHLPVNSRSGT